MGYKEDFRLMSPNLLAVTGIFVLLFLLPSGWGWFVLCVTTPFVIKDLILLKGFKQLLTKSYGAGLLKTVIISSVVYWFIRLTGRYALLSFIIIVFGFSAYKLWVARVFYLDKIREIEIMIWGKTNDRKKK